MEYDIHPKRHLPVTHPSLVCCMENDVTTVLFCLSGYHKKSTCILLCVKLAADQTLEKNKLFSSMNKWFFQSYVSKFGLFLTPSITHCHHKIIFCYTYSVMIPTPLAPTCLTSFMSPPGPCDLWNRPLKVYVENSIPSIYVTSFLSISCLSNGEHGLKRLLRMVTSIPFTRCLCYKPEHV